MNLVKDLPTVILAGGRGKRLRPIVCDIPKVMVPINGQPFLDYVLEWLTKYGIGNVYMSVGYLRERIIEYYGDGSSIGFHIDYITEKEPLGTGGALKTIVDVHNFEEFILINGDSILPINLTEFYTYHHRSKAIFTMACSYQNDCSNYGAIEYDNNLYLRRFSEKTYSGSGWINGGTYLVNSDKVKKYLIRDKCSLEVDILPRMIKNKCVKAYLSDIQYFVDIGTPDSYKMAQKQLSKVIF